MVAMNMVVICLFLAIFASLTKGSEYEEAMRDLNIYGQGNHYEDAPSRKFFLQGREADPEPTIHHQNDEMPFGELGDKGTITIEQFVKALRKKKQLQAAKKQAQAAKKSQTKTAHKTNKPVKAKSQKSIKSIPKGKGNKQIKASKNKKKAVSKQIKKQPAKTTQSVKGKSSANRKPVSSGKSQKKSKKTPVHEQKTKGSQQVKKTKVVTPKKKSQRRPKSKAAPAKKPVTKSKVSKKAPAEEEEDPFLSGSLNAHQHSDHHVHHHDHLESHKHHHKHKEDHSHDHAHENDHVHNHKHTHNHVHNHIHKHNEAHEHSAEHQHTEKHHHKHLEYIDAGGWKRRQDQNQGIILADEVKEDPSLIIEERGFKAKAEDPKDNVRNYLKKYIDFYTAGNEEENHSLADNTPDDHSHFDNIPDDHSHFDNIPDDHSHEGINHSQFDTIFDDHSHFDNIPDDHSHEDIDHSHFDEIHDNHSHFDQIPDDHHHHATIGSKRNSDGYFSKEELLSSFQPQESMHFNGVFSDDQPETTRSHFPGYDGSMRERTSKPKSMEMYNMDKSTSKKKYPVEVEEISYAEYLRLQKKGETFEEELDDYEDYGESQGIEYNMEDQIPYGTNENVVRQQFEKKSSFEEEEFESPHQTYSEDDYQEEVTNYEIDDYHHVEDEHDWVPEEYDLRPIADYGEVMDSPFYGNILDDHSSFGADVEDSFVYDNEGNEHQINGDYSDDDYPIISRSDMQSKNTVDNIDETVTKQIPLQDPNYANYYDYDADITERKDNGELSNNNLEEETNYENDEDITGKNNELVIKEQNIGKQINPFPENENLDVPSLIEYDNFA